MARLGNKKSRKGCVRCKSRRVKCDEARPACGWCVSHGFRCEYPTQFRINSNQAPASRSSQSRSEALSGSPRTPQATTPAIDEATRPQLELALFHYYASTVAKTFPFSNTERGLELHADIIPQASLRCSNLLDVMHAYALLHMHIQSASYGRLPRNADFFEDLGIHMKDPQSPRVNSKVDLLSLHRDYLSKALQGQRDVVAEINTKNADGICIAAVLLAQIALVHSSEVRFDEGYYLPTDWFRLQASFATCLRASRPLLSMDSATSMLIHSNPSIDNHNLGSHVLGVFKDLADWQPEGDSQRVDFQTKEMYRKCVAYLETVYQRISQQEPWHMLGRRILAFPNIDGAAFLKALEDYQPRAMVILAHVLAMTKRLEYSWWICKDVADYHVRGIATMVPVEWQWALEWPMKVVETGASDDCFLAESPLSTTNTRTTPY